MNDSRAGLMHGSPAAASLSNAAARAGENGAARRTTRLVIRASSGWGGINVGELWRSRDLLMALAARDIKVRYKQTALGVAWVILLPMVSALIFAFVFGRVAKMPSGDVPYLLLAYSGIVGWNLFGSTLNRAASCLVSNASLVAKVYFPRLVLPLSVLPSVLLDFAIAMVVMGAMVVWFGAWPGAGVLLLPVWVLMLILPALGIGVWCAALMVKYRDVGIVLGVATQMLMYASPVAYPASAVPERFRFYYFMNPAAAPLEAFRWSVLGTPFPSWGALAWSASAGAVLVAAGAMIFRRMERQFADVI